MRIQFYLFCILLATFILDSDGKKPKCKCGIHLPAPKTNSRIYNGQNAPLNEYPWLAFIQVEYKTFPTPTGRFPKFGGVLVSNKHVLTCSHPFYEPYYNKT